MAASVQRELINFSRCSAHANCAPERRQGLNR